MMRTRFRRDPDVLVIDCAIPGASIFASEVRGDMKIIGISSRANDCKNCADLLRAKLRDPEDKAPERIPYCADVIEALVKEQRHDSRAGGA